MKHLAAAICFSLLAMTPAVGADTPSKLTAPALKGVQAPLSWSGFYVGLNAGYGSSTVRDEVIELAGSLPDTFTFKRKIDGPSVGAQIGFNLQHEAFVWGVEADFQKSWQRNQIQFTLFGDPSFLDLEAPWFATARLRAGVASGLSFVYVTGGALWTDRRPTVFSGEGSDLFRFSDKVNGWVIGAGYESMLSRDWTWKIEYLYTRPGDARVGNVEVDLVESARDHIIRVGVNYRFGG